MRTWASAENSWFSLIALENRYAIGFHQKAIFINFYSPYCGHCRHFAPTWQEFGEFIYDNGTYTNYPDLIIAEIDVTKNEFADFQIFATPTLKYYPKGEQKKAIDYPWNRRKDFESLIEFIGEQKGKEYVRVDDSNFEGSGSEAP